MSARRTMRRLAPRPAAPLAVAIAALIGMGVFLALAPKAAAGGWLAAFLLWSGIPLGSLLTLMIHALTGGDWGLRFAPHFVTAAAAIPLMALLVVPVLAALPGFYPWVFGHGGAQADVAAWYLNAPFFIARTGIGFAGWTALAFLLPRLAGTAAAIAAGLGLIFYGVTICLVGTDWVLSLAPGFTSTSFGATLAFAQLASALAWAAIAAATSPARADPMMTRERFMGAPEGMESLAGAQPLRRLVKELQVRLEVAAHEAFVEMVAQRRDLGGGQRTVARVREEPRGGAAVQVERVIGHALPPRTSLSRGTSATRAAPGAG